MVVIILPPPYGRSTEELHMSTGTSWQQRESPWAIGLTGFATALLVIGGVWHAFAGIAALVHDKVYVSTPGYVYSFNLTGWGWIQLLLGILAAIAGFGVLRGQTWARIVGTGFAFFSMAIQFLLIPFYPIWSLLMIALDLGIIWALAVYRRDAV
jgi:hypothetical protein